MSGRGAARRRLTCLPHYLFGDVLVLELGRQVEDGLHCKTLDVCAQKGQGTERRLERMQTASAAGFCPVVTTVASTSVHTNGKGNLQIYKTAHQFNCIVICPVSGLYKPKTTKTNQ